jgi:N6-adenosine-specific RNA methylase IME4
MKEKDDNVAEGAIFVAALASIGCGLIFGWYTGSAIAGTGMALLAFPFAICLLAMVAR